MAKPIRIISLGRRGSRNPKPLARLRNGRADARSRTTQLVSLPKQQNRRNKQTNKQNNKKKATIRLRNGRRFDRDSNMAAADAALPVLMKIIHGVQILKFQTPSFPRPFVFERGSENFIFGPTQKVKYVLNFYSRSCSNLRTTSTYGTVLKDELVLLRFTHRQTRSRAFPKSVDDRKRKTVECNGRFVVFLSKYSMGRILMRPIELIARLPHFVAFPVTASSLDM